MEADILMPGEHCTAYLALLKEMPVRQSIPFALRESSKKTVARGIIREVLPTVDVESFKDIKNRGFKYFIKYGDPSFM